MEEKDTRHQENTAVIKELRGKIQKNVVKLTEIQNERGGFVLFLFRMGKNKME